MLKFILKLFEGLSSDLVNEIGGLNEMDDIRIYLSQEDTIRAYRPVFHLRASIIQNIVGIIFLMLSRYENVVYWILPYFLIFIFFFILYAMLDFGTVSGYAILPTKSKYTTLSCQRKVKFTDLFSNWFCPFFITYIIQTILYIIIACSLMSTHLNLLISSLSINWGLFMIIFVLGYMLTEGSNYVEFSTNEECIIYYRDKTKKNTTSKLSDSIISIAKDGNLLIRDFYNPFHLTHMQLIPLDEIDYIQIGDIKLIPIKKTGNKEERYELTIE